MYWCYIIYIDALAYGFGMVLEYNVTTIAYADEDDQDMEWLHTRVTHGGWDWARQSDRNENVKFFCLHSMENEMVVDCTKENHSSAIQLKSRMPTFCE